MQEPDEPCFSMSGYLRKGFRGIIREDGRVAGRWAPAAGRYEPLRRSHRNENTGHGDWIKEFMLRKGREYEGSEIPNIGLVRLVRTLELRLGAPLWLGSSSLGEQDGGPPTLIELAVVRLRRGRLGPRDGFSYLSLRWMG